MSIRLGRPVISSNSSFTRCYRGKTRLIFFGCETTETMCYTNYLHFVAFPVHSTRTNLEKKLAQTTAKSEEEKASAKKHHSSIAKVR